MNLTLDNDMASLWQQKQTPTSNAFTYVNVTDLRYAFQLEDEPVTDCKAGAMGGPAPDC
jgi:hypothetical protein